MSATSLDLSQIKTDVLSAASTFRTLIGLGNLNNTADSDKPISTATQSALDAKLGGSTGITDNRVLRSDGTGGATVQNSAVTIDDSGNMTGVGTVSLNSATATTNGFNTPIAGNGFWFTSGGYFNCSSNGVFKFLDSATTSFGRLQLGGTTSSYPSIKRNGAAINFRLADDSADAPITASYVTLGTSGTLVGGTNLIEQRNSTNAQTLRIYGTYTDGSNYRRLLLTSTTGGVFSIIADGAGTGASGNSIKFDLVNVNYLTIGNNLNSFSRKIRVEEDTGGGSGESGAQINCYNNSGGSGASGIRIYGSNGSYVNSGCIAVFGSRVSSFVYQDTLRIVGGSSNGAIQFGGYTSSEPMIKRSGTELCIKLADDSAFCGFRAGAGTFSGDLILAPSASITPSSNGQLTFEATSDTSITVKYKGSDGTVRSAVLTLT